MLRKFFIASASIFALGSTAFAADLPTTKGPAVYTPPPPIFTWTGVYIGAQVGYEWGRSYTDAVAGPFAANFPAYTPDGVAGGAHLGYNYQLGYFVVGLEGDVNGSSFRGTALGALGSKEPIDGSVRGRIGYTWDRALIYATGGAAFGDFNNFDIAGDSNWATRVGWTAGAGLEYAIDNNWSLRAEYRYTQFGRYFFTPAAFAPLGVAFGSRQIDNRVQAGFSYKFDWAQPIVSKY